jgi:ABC-type branched-subunit amino acid transport system permease subunit
VPVLTRTSGRSAILARVADLPRSSRRRAVEAVLLLALVALPLLASDGFLVGRFGRDLVWAVFALSLDLIWGFGGMLTFGHAAFFGGAGYAVALLTTRDLGPLPLPVWPAIFIAVLLAGSLALLTGILAFRGRAPLRGVEFALVTLAIAYLMEQYARSSQVLGGQNGILLSARLDIGPLSLHRGHGFYVLAAVLLVGSYVVVRRFLAGRDGRVLQAIRDDEERVELLGYDAGRVKLVTYVLSGSIAGLAGAVFHVHDAIVSPAAVGVGASTVVLLWVVLGGRGTLLGPIIATVVLQHLTATLSGVYLETWLIAVGVVLILAIVVLPGGLLGWTARGQQR